MKRSIEPSPVTSLHLASEVTYHGEIADQHFGKYVTNPDEPPQIKSFVRLEGENVPQLPLSHIAGAILDIYANPVTRGYAQLRGHSFTSEADEFLWNEESRLGLWRRSVGFPLMHFCKEGSGYGEIALAWIDNKHDTGIVIRDATPMLLGKLARRAAKLRPANHAQRVTFLSRFEEKTTPPRRASAG
jgi:hypothetical protein